MDELLVHFLNGMSYGTILFLLASGLSFTLGCMGVLNLTHGSLYMIGAYVGLTLAGLRVNFWVAALLGGVAVALIGLVLDRIFLRHLYRQMLDQVLLTLGFVYIFANVTLWIWGAFPKLGAPPPFLAGSIAVGHITFPVYRFALIAMGVVIAIGLWWLQDKTRVGAIIRAGMDDKQMAMGLGVNYALVSSAIFCLGAFVGGFAGFVGSPVLGVHSEIAFPILLLTLVVIIVGGEGSVQGALLGAILVGLVDAFGKAFFPDLAMFTIYAVLVIFLLVRPSGLFGKR